MEYNFIGLAYSTNFNGTDCVPNVNLQCNSKMKCNLAHRLDPCVDCTQSYELFLCARVRGRANERGGALIYEAVNIWTRPNVHL